MNTSPALYLNCIIDPIIKQVISEIYDENQTSKLGKENVVRAYLDILLIKLSRHYQSINSTEQPVKITYRIRELESLVDQHFRKLKQPSEYAELMHLSQKYLNDICKKGLDKTISQVIQERILLEAKRLLLYSEQTISEISFSLGYQDHSYFSRFFKNKTTESPEEFRKSHLNVPNER